MRTCRDPQANHRYDRPLEVLLSLSECTISRIYIFDYRSLLSITIILSAKSNLPSLSTPLLHVAHDNQR
jgi:hypothetical protein